MRKGYAYSLPQCEIDRLIEQLKSITTGNWKAGLVQHAMASVKRISYGVKLHVWVLAYNNGYCGPGEGGISKEGWDTLVTLVRGVLTDALGKIEITGDGITVPATAGGAPITLTFRDDNNKLYVESFSTKRKFQLSFVTKIQYKELGD